MYTLNTGLFIGYIATLIYVCVSQNYEKNFPIYEWSLGSSTTPRRGYIYTIGYDNISENIWLISGIKEDYLTPNIINDLKKVKYSTITGTFTDYGNVFSQSLYGDGQPYTQANEYVYVISGTGGAGLHRFNVQTENVDYNYVSSIPVNAHSWGSCLTSFTDNGILYLAVIGGISNWNGVNWVQIYNTQSGLWLSNVPTMKTIRGQGTCQFCAGKLFAIGGYTNLLNWVRTNTIEILDVSNIANIANEQWEYISPATLANTEWTSTTNMVSNQRSIVRDGHILMFGGDAGDTSGSQGFQIDEIYKLNCVTHKLITDGNTDIELYGTAPIIAKDKLYLFGGRIDVSYPQKFINTWRYINLPPSPAPSPAPTLPTQSPIPIPPSPVPPPEPTNTPTYSSLKIRNFTSNYVKNFNYFRKKFLNDFVFPAAIGQCMNEYFGSGTYIKYDCLDDETALHNIYSNSKCDDDKLISGATQYYNPTDDEFICNETDTFIELELFSVDPTTSITSCPESDKSIMFIADSVCSESSISNNNLFNAYCNHYNATSQSESIYTNNEVWFQYFNG
eukprot:304427_1